MKLMGYFNLSTKLSLVDKLAICKTEQRLGDFSQILFTVIKFLFETGPMIDKIPYG